MKNKGAGVMTSSAKSKTLKVLYSFRSGMPSAEDLKYVDFQKKLDPKMACGHAEIYMSWLYYLLTQHYGLYLDENVFLHEIMLDLWKRGLIQAPTLDKNSGLVTVLLGEPDPFRGIDFPVKISDHGVDLVESEEQVSGSSTIKKTPKKIVLERCFEVEGIGYLQLYEGTSPIKIGKVNSRHYRLLRCLADPSWGTTKTIDYVFEAIRHPKDAEDSLLNSDLGSQRRKKKIIEYAIKELQKGGKMRKIKIHMGVRDIRAEIQRT